MTLKSPENLVASTPPAGDDLRARVGAFVHSETCRNAVLGIIVFNAICLGLDTDHGLHARYGQLLTAIDRLITMIFVIEIGLKLYADRSAFFRDGWNVFDFIVVSLAALFVGAQPEVSMLRIFRLLRVVRVLRVFRLFGVVPAMRRVVDALLAAIPGMSAIIAVLALLFYVTAVVTTDLFGAEFPVQFGSVGASVFTLFQIMSGDGWSDIVRRVMWLHPWAWMFFVPFIVLTSFAILNLFIAVIVDALQAGQKEERALAQAEIKSEIGEARDDLEGEIEESHEELSKDIDAAQEIAAGERAKILHALDALRAEIADLRAQLPPKT